MQVEITQMKAYTNVMNVWTFHKCGKQNNLVQHKIVPPPNGEAYSEVMWYGEQLYVIDVVGNVYNVSIQDVFCK